jgi:16S rRNA (guanine527-N7)-methyltransferase
VNVETFLAQAAALGVHLDGAQVMSVLRFQALLEDGNRRAALTTKTEMADFLQIHVLDSLTLTRAIAAEPAPPARLLDVGSGAGFPAIPLAIAYPKLEVFALESLQKKCDFLRATAQDLGLASRFHVIQERAEEAGRDPKLRDSMDIVTARAVAGLPILVELALPFVRPQGLFVAWKSARAQTDEIPTASIAIKELGGQLEHVLESGVPGRDLRLVRIRKLGPTPERYPRRTGVPEKRPLR